MKSKRAGKALLTIFLLVFALICTAPLAVTVTNSFMDEAEIKSNYHMIGSGNTGNLENAANSDNSDNATNAVKKHTSFAVISLIPDMITIKQYYTVLIKRTQFLFMFWNSVILVIPIVAGQFLVASMAAYAFSKIEFAGREKLFFIYIIVMLMPFQVTLVPNYLVADKLGLINNILSIILPGVFSTFGVFLLKQFMTYIPDAYAEAAKVEGAGHCTVFLQIIIPMSKTGIAAMLILVFIDNWNMVEQPLIFLRDIYKQPLSVYLSQINMGERGIGFAASVIYMAPMLLVFLYGEDYLIEGIQLSGIKG